MRLLVCFNFTCMIILHKSFRCTDASVKFICQTRIFCDAIYLKESGYAYPRFARCILVLLINFLDITNHHL